MAPKGLFVVEPAASESCTGPGVADSCSDSDFVIHQHRLREEGAVGIQLFKDVLVHHRLFPRQKSKSGRDPPSGGVKSVDREDLGEEVRRGFEGSIKDKMIWLTKDVDVISSTKKEGSSKVGGVRGVPKK